MSFRERTAAGQAFSGSNRRPSLPALASFLNFRHHCDATGNPGAEALRSGLAGGGVEADAARQRVKIGLPRSGQNGRIMIDVGDAN